MSQPGACHLGVAAVRKSEDAREVGRAVLQDTNASGMGRPCRWLAQVRSRQSRDNSPGGGIRVTGRNSEKLTSVNNQERKLLKKEQYPVQGECQNR